MKWVAINMASSSFLMIDCKILRQGNITENSKKVKRSANNKKEILN